MFFNVRIVSKSPVEFSPPISAFMELRSNTMSLKRKSCGGMNIQLREKNLSGFTKSTFICVSKT